MTRRFTARRVAAMLPGSAQWLKYMSASKVSAVLGLSPWESPFSLWHKMSGGIGPEPETDEQARGHYLEPALAAWWTDRHPEYSVQAGGSWVHRHRGWQLSTPDRLARHKDTGVWRPVELKTSADDTEWGDEGTAEIPVYVRAQTLWQLDTLGLDEATVVVLTSRLEFREYTVTYDEADAEVIRRACTDFLATLERGEQPPIDGHTATWRAIRELHPDIDDTEADIPDEIGERWLRARQALTDAKDTELAARGEVADSMGNARHGMWRGQRIAVRQARGVDGTPFVVADRHLPHLPLTDKAVA